MQYLHYMYLDGTNDKGLLEECCARLEKPVTGLQVGSIHEVFDDGHVREYIVWEKWTAPSSTGEETEDHLVLIPHHRWHH